MTPAGQRWTRRKPTEAGCGLSVVRVFEHEDSDGKGPRLVVELTEECFWAVDDYDERHQWLGPISPSTYHQGRVAGMREAAKIARNHKGGYTLDVFTAKLVTDPDGPWTLGSDIADAVEQAAQDEKPTKEDL